MLRIFRNSYIAIWIVAGEGEVFGTISQSNLQIGVIVMKKKNIVIHFLVLLMLIATFAACAATRR
jgi:hypothetical protein